LKQILTKRFADFRTEIGVVYFSGSIFGSSGALSLSATLSDSDCRSIDADRLDGHRRFCGFRVAVLGSAPWLFSLQVRFQLQIAD
jgi:hypothetical protein